MNKLAQVSISWTKHNQLDFENFDRLDRLERLVDRQLIDSTWQTTDWLSTR